MFLNNLTANDNYPLQDYENLSSPIQMQLSLKRKTVSDSVVPFLESTSNFKHFEKKDDRHSYFIPEITECERLGWTKLLQKEYESTVIMFFRQSDRSWSGKYLP